MRLFEDDIAEHGRPYESVKVVRYWNLTDDVYELEENPVAERCESYRVTTAERILYRRKIRNLSVQEAFLERPAILDQALVPRGPSLRELLAPEVHVAMTFVPLAGVRGAKSCLGRLYCISGLPFHACPFEDGLPVHAENFGWMLLGMPEDIRRTGESWNLAANLLMAALNATNAYPLIQELTKRIVTGRVDPSGHVLRIEELESKIEFIKSYSTFNRLKWMVPEENSDEAAMINADMPGTLEQALRLIESNRSIATDVLVSEISSEAPKNSTIVKSLRIGADVSAELPGSRENLLQTLKRRTCERIFGVLERKRCTSDVMDEVQRVFDECTSTQRIFSYYADLPQMFFTLARRRMDVAIEAMLSCYGADAINATDIDGETALDFALDNDLAAAGILKKHGAVVRGIYRAGSRKMREMIIRGASGFSDEVYQYFLDAVASGFLDLNTMIDLGAEGIASKVSLVNDYWCCGEKLVDSYGNLCGVERTTTICRRRKTNVFLEAVLLDVTGELVKKCVEVGVNVNMPIEFCCDKSEDWDGDGNFLGFVSVPSMMRTPLELSELSSNEMVGKFLKKAGAKSYFSLYQNKIVKVN